MMLPPIYTWLKTTQVQAIIGNPHRAYRHGSAPQDSTRPYVTWQLISGIPDNTLSELPKVDRMSVQVDCWHQTDLGIEELATAVRDALEPYGHMTAINLNLREAETKLYRISLQFDIWLDRVVSLLALSGDMAPGLLALSDDPDDNLRVSI
jgi:hypothetical protein